MMIGKTNRHNSIQKKISRIKRIMTTFETRSDTRDSGQIFAEDEDLRREDKHHSDRMERMIDYTPIDERDKPCLTSCGHHGVTGCQIYGNKIINMKNCKEYNEWLGRR